MGQVTALYARGLGYLRTALKWGFLPTVMYIGFQTEPAPTYVVPITTVS